MSELNWIVGHLSGVTEFLDMWETHSDVQSEMKVVVV